MLCSEALYSLETYEEKINLKKKKLIFPYDSHQMKAMPCFMKFGFLKCSLLQVFHFFWNAWLFCQLQNRALETQKG